MEDHLAANAESLLAELGWIRSLARQLVRDVAAADDLVQETLLAALERRPGTEKPLRPWLGTVLRRRAALTHRGDARRREREERGAQAEALPSAEALASRAEAQREVVDAVLALDEPYRSTVLLRYFEGLEPNEIARRRGLPAATVRSHLKRGLEQLRATLDRRHGGDSRAWCLALIPLAIDEAGVKSVLTTSATATLALLVMNTWFQLAVGAVVLAALSVLFWPQRRGGLPFDANAAATPFADVAGTAAGTPEAASQPAHVERSEVSSPEVAVAPIETPKLAGRVVDATTRTPLAEFALTIDNSDGTKEHLVTDAQGRFTSALERQAGQHSLVLIDVAAPLNANRLNGDVLSWSEGTSRDVAWDGRNELEISVPTGPVYGLRFVPPKGLTTADFEAELFDHDPLTAAPEIAILSQRTSVRGGSRPFARFAASGMPYAGFEFMRDALSRTRQPESGPWTLRVESRDGLWAGRTRVPMPDDGSAHEIALEPAATVRLEFVSAERIPLSEPVLLIERVANRRTELRSSSAFSGEPLAIELRALEPGAYRFTFRALGMRAVHDELELAPGQRLERTLLVEPLAVAGFVRGELRSRSGRFDDDVTVALTGPDGEMRNAFSVWEERDGELVAPFAFEGLAHGEYHIAFYGWRSANQHWSPETTVVRAPSEGLVFECDDTTQRQRVIFRVTSADDGEPIADANVTAFIGERVLVSEHSQAPGETAFEIYAGASLRWSVSAPRFVEVHGDSSSFGAGGDDLLQVIALERAP